MFQAGWKALPLYMIILDALSKKLHTLKVASAADRIIHLKNTKGPWETIDFIVKFWAGDSKNKYDSFVCYVNEKRSNRLNEYGSNKSKSLRETVDIPVKIISMIRAVYRPEELPFDKVFLKEVWKRYPQFRVASKL